MSWITGNQNDTTLSSSEDASKQKDLIDETSPVVKNLSIGFDHHTPQKLNILNLNQLKIRKKVKNSKTKEAKLQILQECNGYHLTAWMFKLAGTKRVSFYGAAEHVIAL